MVKLDIETYQVLNSFEETWNDPSINDLVAACCSCLISILSSRLLELLVARAASWHWNVADSNPEWCRSLPFVAVSFSESEGVLSWVSWGASWSCSCSSSGLVKGAWPAGSIQGSGVLHTSHCYLDHYRGHQLWLLTTFSCNRRIRRR